MNTGHFTEDELDTVLKTIKSRKTAGLKEIPPEIQKTGKIDAIFLWLCNTVYNQKHNREMDERMHPSLPKERRPQNH